MTHLATLDGLFWDWALILLDLFHPLSASTHKATSHRVGRLVKLHSFVLPRPDHRRHCPPHHLLLLSKRKRVKLGRDSVPRRIDRHATPLWPLLGYLWTEVSGRGRHPARVSVNVESILIRPLRQSRPPGSCRNVHGLLSGMRRRPDDATTHHLQRLPRRIWRWPFDHGDDCDVGSDLTQRPWKVGPSSIC